MFVFVMRHNPRHRNEMELDCRYANVILLTYACDRPSTLDCVTTHWLPMLRWLRVRVPVIVVGCKLDLKDEGAQVMPSMIREQFPEIETCSIECSALEQIQGIKKTLLMREVPEDSVKTLLSNKESLAACDIAVFVHDSADESSWKKATELLVQVASHGENSGYEVPCLIVSAKDDLDPYPLAIQDSTRVSQDMGIDTPIPVSMKLRDYNNLFCRIITAAQHPHLSIPETEAGRNRKQYRKLVNRSLMFVSVGAAVAVVGLAAYRVYASRKNTSS